MGAGGPRTSHRASFGYDPAVVGIVQRGANIRELESRLASVAPWLLAAYLIVPPLFKASLQPFSPVDLTVLLAIPTAAVGSGWLFLRRADLDRRRKIALGLWLALAALVTAGIIWAPDTRLAASSAAYFVVLATLPLLAAFPVGADEARVRQFLIVFVAAGLMFVAIATVALIAGELGGRDVIGTNRIGVARALLFVPLVGIPLFAWNHIGRRSWALVAVSGLAVFLAVATTSRAAPLFFVVVGVALALGALLVSGHRRRVMALSGGILVCTLVAFVALSGLISERSALRFGGLVDAAADALDEPGTASGDGLGEEELEDPEGRPSSIVQRTGLYRLAAQLFLAQPVVGVGTSGFEVAARNDPTVVGADYPHNLPLQVASEFGMVGLALVGALGILAAMTWRPWTSVSVALGALFAFLLLNAMLSNGVYENRMLWGVWLVLLAYQPIRDSAPEGVAHSPR